MRDRLLQLGIDAYKWISRYHTFGVRQVKVETTKTCNLKCIGCRRNFAETLAKAPGPKNLTVGALWRICATTNMEIVRFEGDGEPTCNPNFRDLVSWCHKMGIRSAMTSNGTLLDEEHVRFLEENGMVRIHISFDGATKETFEKQRVGAKYQQVLNVCRLIGQSKIQLFLNCVPSTDAIIRELPDYVNLAKEVGASGILLIKFQADKGFGTPVDWSRYSGLLEEVKGEAKKKGLIFIGTGDTEPTFHECEDPYVCPYVTLDDSVYACAYMANMRTTEVYMGEVIPCPSSNYIMGNLNDGWMKDIWRDGAYRELRQVLKRTSRPNRDKTSREALLGVKKEFPKDNVRFQYCTHCLCRWGETGL